MADLRLYANILFAQSIREKENSKELSFLSRIVNAVLMRKTKSPPSYGELGRVAFAIWDIKRTQPCERAAYLRECRY